MPRFALLIAPLALGAIAFPAAAQSDPALLTSNPQIDYTGFLDLTQQLANVREEHLIGWDEFAQRTKEGGAILLDARSAAAFAQGHIEGAVNLPFSDFTDDKLAAVLGPDKGRPIYIYCNNNFSDNRAPVATKRAPLALNIPTFINLHGYGYTNVWELRDVLATADVPWVAGGGAPHG